MPSCSEKARRLLSWENSSPPIWTCGSIPFGALADDFDLHPKRRFNAEAGKLARGKCKMISIQFITASLQDYSFVQCGMRFLDE
jgi:hypothetical protein